MPTALRTKNAQITRSRLGADVSRSLKTKFETLAREYGMSNQEAVERILRNSLKNWEASVA